MTIAPRRIAACVALAAMTANPTFAQESSGNADLPLGTPVENAPEAGQTYVKEVFKDWELRCIRTGQETDPCQLYQLMTDGSGQAVAEINLFPLPAEQAPAVAGATVVTPLETLLPRGVSIAVDDGTAKEYPFTFCSQIGCFARLGLTEEDLASFKRGVAARIAVVPVAAPDQLVELSISLSGFTAAFDAVSALAE